MEQTITGIEILPREQAVVTPRELLEDFADHTERWLFLEQETEHYTDERGEPSALLHLHRSEEPREINFIFVARTDRHGAYHLRLIAPAKGDPLKLTPRERQQAIEQFAADFEAYLASCNEPLRLEVTHADEQPVVPTS